MDLTSLGEGAIGGMGAAGTAAAGLWKIAAGMLKSKADESVKEALKPIEKSIDHIQDQIDRMAETMEEHGMACRKLENAEGQTQLNLMKHFQTMAEKSAEFRDALRSDFVTKDSVDGRILRLISEHCRNCPRRESK